jgi:hypothetical protein
MHIDMTRTIYRRIKRPGQLLPQLLLMVLLELLLMPLAHSDYDFNDPKYRVNNPPEPIRYGSTSSSRDSSNSSSSSSSGWQSNNSVDPEQARRDAREQEIQLDRERAEKLRILQNIQRNELAQSTFSPHSSQSSQQFTFSGSNVGSISDGTTSRHVVIVNGQEVPFEQFMKEHPGAVDHGDHVTVSKFEMDNPRSAANNYQAPDNDVGSAFGIMVVLAVLAYGGWGLIGKFNARKQDDEVLSHNDLRELARGGHGASALAGADLPLTMRRGNTEPPPPNPSDKPIEFVRSTPSVAGVGAAAAMGAASSLAGSSAAAPATASTTTSVVNSLVLSQLDAFSKDLPHEPIQYGNQLKKVGLDYSAASLARLDLFLNQLRDKTNPDAHTYGTRPEYRNLLILVGMYVGTTIARLTDQPVKWYDYAGAKVLLDRKGYGDSVQTAYSCILGKTNHYLPIELVYNILFSANDISCIDSLNAQKQRL